MVNGSMARGSTAVTLSMVPGHRRGFPMCKAQLWARAPREGCGGHGTAVGSLLMWLPVHRAVSAPWSRTCTSAAARHGGHEVFTEGVFHTLLPNVKCLREHVFSHPCFHHVQFLVSVSSVIMGSKTPVLPLPQMSPPHPPLPLCSHLAPCSERSGRVGLSPGCSNLHAVPCRRASCMAQGLRGYQVSMKGRAFLFSQ